MDLKIDELSENITNVEKGDVNKNSKHIFHHMVTQILIIFFE